MRIVQWKVLQNEKENGERAGPALADWGNGLALQLPDADNEEVSVTDKGEIRRRDDCAEKWDSGALGQINQRASLDWSSGGPRGHRKRRADEETREKSRCPSDMSSPSPQAPSTFTQVSDWTKQIKLKATQQLPAIVPLTSGHKLPRRWPRDE